MVYTIKNVLIRPGESVRQFIAEDRHRFVKPITFLFICTLLFAFVSNPFNIRTSNYEGPEGILSLILNWLFDHPSYFNLLIGLFVAFWIKIFFRKSEYNIFEIFILFCFVYGIMKLFELVVVIIQVITHLELINIAIGIGVIYITWATGQFFNKKKMSSYIKAFLSFIFGILTFGILIGIAIVIETIIKQ